MNFFRKLPAAFCLVVGLLQAATAAPSINIPFTADRWTTQGDLKFQKLEGFPNGLMESKGSAVLNGLVFGDGAIDVDVIFGGGIATLMFRRGDGEGETLVLRPQPNCPASNDCIQYTPFIHGAFLYDLYPQYQRQAPLSEKGWNHIRIVASGKRMNVFLNGLSSPALAVTRMEGNLTQGGIRLSGRASWANLVISPGETGVLPKTPAPDPAARDAHFVRAWTVAASQPVSSTVDKKLDAQLGVLPTVAPATLKQSRPLVAETGGLINLSRAVGSAKSHEITGVWLETRMSSDRDQIKRVQIGWVREIAVFVNGEPAFADRNLYGVATLQKMPDGRIGLENGQFNLHLRNGLNRIQVFVDDNAGGGQAFGWGFKMRLDDLLGVRLVGGNHA